MYSTISNVLQIGVNHQSTIFGHFRKLLFRCEIIFCNILVDLSRWEDNNEKIRFKKFSLFHFSVGVWYFKARLYPRKLICKLCEFYFPMHFQFFFNLVKTTKLKFNLFTNVFSRVGGKPLHYQQLLEAYIAAVRNLYCSC